MRGSARHMAPLAALAAVVLGVGVVAGSAFLPGSGDDAGRGASPAVAEPAADRPGGDAPRSAGAGTVTATSTVPPHAPWHPLVDRRSVGEPWGTVPGVLMFRGNPTRTWYGTGPVPADPEVLWRYPERPMCGLSTVGRETSEWCGTGWTGQPVVWERPDGVTEVIVGAYDHAIHFVDAATGLPTRPPFLTGDLVKGSVTLDPDGWPLLYAGSRDDKLRVIALDRPEPTELWALTPHPQRVWNSDWDGNPVVVDGLLIVGGEDSWFRVVDLDRHRGPDGLVGVAPRVLAEIPGFDDELFAAVGDRNVSIEGSVAVFEGVAYFANSGGRVMGVDLAAARQGRSEVVFDFWMGDDVDATVVLDGDGMLYVAAEVERFLPRAAEVGQLVKLDPARPEDPLVWSVAVPSRRSGELGGLWATPALHRGVLYATTHPGELLAVDTATGEVLWREPVAYHSWSSPVVVDDTVVAATCSGHLLAIDVSDPRRPVTRWRFLGAGGCIESTPAVWDGRIYVGSRDGFLYAIGEGRARRVRR